MNHFFELFSGFLKISLLPRAGRFITLIGKEDTCANSGDRFSNIGVAFFTLSRASVFFGAGAAVLTGFFCNLWSLRGRFWYSRLLLNLLACVPLDRLPGSLGSFCFLTSVALSRHLRFLLSSYHLLASCPFCYTGSLTLAKRSRTEGRRHCLTEFGL
jgi:hypothetical protein